MQTLTSRKSQMSGFAYTIEVVGICMVIVTIFAALEAELPGKICNGISHLLSASADGTSFSLPKGGLICK